LRKNNSKNLTEFSVISRTYVLPLPPVNLPLNESFGYKKLKKELGKT